MDTAGASRWWEVCKHQTSGYSDRRFAADVGSRAIKPSLLRHSRATVDPDRGRLSAPQQRFTINREPVDLQVNQAGLTPQKLASNPGSGIHSESPAIAGFFCLGKGTRKGLETRSDGRRPNQIRTDFSAGLPDLGFGVDPLGVLVLGDQVCVGGEQHCQRVAELLGHVHRLAPFGEQ